MARNNMAGSRFAWSTIFYLLLVLVAPMVFLGTPAKAQDTPKDNQITGPGTH